VLTYFALLFFRVLIIQNHGLEANGFYQGGWSLSSYIITIFQSLVIYVLPTISALIQKPEELNREFSEIFHQILILISVAVIFTMIFSSELLMILYTSEFQSAKGIANILIFAQFFSVINLFVSTVVMSLGKLKHFVIIDVGRFLFPLLVVTILPRIFSITLTLENFAMAVLSGQILFFIYAMRYIYTLGIKIGKRSLFLLLRVVFFLLFLILFLMRFDSLWMAIGFFPIAFLIIGPASFREILSKLDFMRGQY
ncbi:hypothetical protein KAJ27_13380, partial [bacterium]|nr:hypothetical protein [bacterium]